MSVTKRLLLAVAFTSVVSACAHKPEVLPTPRLVFTCPRIRTYSGSEMTDMYNESLIYGKKIPALMGLVSEDMSLRDAARRCQKDSASALTSSSVHN